MKTGNPEPEIADLELIASLGRHSTPCLSDAMDKLGLNGGCEGILPLQGGLKCIGPAFTVKFEPVADGEPGAAGDYLDEVPAGRVVVLDNGGRTYCTVWGDILTTYAMRKGISGTVVNGCCRDADTIQELGYPMFSLSRYMKSGKNRVKMTDKEVPVLIGSTRVNPGDIVVADGSGVLCIPRDMAAKVAAIAEEIEAMEALILRDLEGGMDLVASRKRHNYNRFALQQAGRES